MEVYFQPLLYCIGIGTFIWLRGMKGRITPYREPLIEKGIMTTTVKGNLSIVWILRTFNEESRLYRMIQYIHSHYGFKQIVIIPNATRTPVTNEISTLEFFQKTEIAIAILQASHIFSEAGVMETAASTASRANKPAYIFIHDESAKREFSRVSAAYKNIRIFYTSKWIQELWSLEPSFQFHLPVFMKENQTHTERTKIVCLCPNYQWKFQRIAFNLPGYTFLYAPRRAPVFSETDILCILDPTSRYEYALQASASGIPIIAQWSPVLEEILQDYCIFIRGDDAEEWSKAIALLKENPLFYRDQSQKARVLAHHYDSPKEMDVFLNFVKSE